MGDSLEDASAEFTFSEEPFLKSSYNYSKEMVVNSLEFELASFGSSNASLKKQNRNQFDYLKQTGFRDYDCNSVFKEEASYNSIAVGAARKTVRDGSGTATLIACGIRGHNYGSEWVGNCYCGETGNHKGFELARDQVVKFLKSYIKKYHVTGRIKLWVVGYSRGAAVANLVGGYLDDQNPFDNVTLRAKDLYVYCFEPPMCADSSNVNRSNYKNIHNVINPCDLIVQIPLASWGFGRYGVSHYLPSASMTKDYAALRNNMILTFYKDYPGIISPVFIDTFQMLSFDPHKLTLTETGDRVTPVEFYGMLEKAIVRDVMPTRADYLKYQGDIMELMIYLNAVDDSQKEEAFRLFAEKLSFHAERLLRELTAGDVAKAGDDILNDLTKSLNAAGITDYDSKQLKGLVRNFVALVATLAVNDPELTATLLVNLPGLLAGHLPECSSAWIHSLPADYFQ